VIVPDCGLAPGMVSIMVADGVSQFEKTTSIKIRVGGLPQAPRGPLQYQMVFSAEGLLNEYWEPCVILENGKRKIVNPMTALKNWPSTESVILKPSTLQADIDPSFHLRRESRFSRLQDHPLSGTLPFVQNDA